MGTVCPRRGRAGGGRGRWGSPRAAARGGGGRSARGRARGTARLREGCPCAGGGGNRGGFVRLKRGEALPEAAAVPPSGNPHRRRGGPFAFNPPSRARPPRDGAADWRRGPAGNGARCPGDRFWVHRSVGAGGGRGGLSLPVGGGVCPCPGALRGAPCAPCLSPAAGANEALRVSLKCHANRAAFEGSGWFLSRQSKG